MLPVTLRSNDGSSYPARYIYAVATDANVRRQGISTALLEAAHTQMHAWGEAASLLVPATPALFSFYEKRGYSTAFLLDIVTYAADQLPPVPRQADAAACSAAAYTRTRDQAFAGSRLYAQWTEADAAFAVSTFAKRGGVTALSWEGGYGCAAWEKTDTGVLVRELALTDGSISDVLSVLHQQLGARQYTVRLAQGSAPGTAPQPYGMIRWLIQEPAVSGAPPYLSLAMD